MDSDEHLNIILFHPVHVPEYPLMHLLLYYHLALKTESQKSNKVENKPATFCMGLESRSLNPSTCLIGRNKPFFFLHQRLSWTRRIRATFIRSPLIVSMHRGNSLLPILRWSPYFTMYVGDRFISARCIIKHISQIIQFPQHLPKKKVFYNKDKAVFLFLTSSDVNRTNLGSPESPFSFISGQYLYLAKFIAYILETDPPGK